MARPPGTDTKQHARERRRARLAAELRSNLLKRKAQARGRALPGAPLAGDNPDNGNDQPDAREAANADMRGTKAEVA
jgi:hypothetical protein